jgi:hypothetical protein
MEYTQFDRHKETFIATDEGWLYLASIEDLCTKKVCGWSSVTE